MTSVEVSHAVRIPADVDREDRVLANLTARQVAIFTVAGLLLYAGFAATRTVVPPAVFAVFAVPLIVASAVLVLGSRDGMSLDRLALAALRQRLAPRVRVAAPEGISPAPDWLLDRVDRTSGESRPSREIAPSTLRLPAEAVTDSTSTGGADVGVIDLGADGVAVVCACSTVNFALRTPSEQEALVACFGRYLHSLASPVQILIRAHRLDLTEQIDALRQRAYALPHPALEAAALEHADYLDDLAAGSDLLQRQVLLILREPIHNPPGRHWSTQFRHRGTSVDSVSADARHAAETRLARRVTETVQLLAPANVIVTPLDSAQATAVLTGACNPDALISPTAVLAGVGDVITTVEPSDLDIVTTLDPRSDQELDRPPTGIQTAYETAETDDDMWWAR